MARIAVTINVNATPVPDPYGVVGNTGMYLARISNMSGTTTGARAVAIAMNESTASTAYDDYVLTSSSQTVYISGASASAVVAVSVMRPGFERSDVFTGSTLFMNQGSGYVTIDVTLTGNTTIQDKYSTVGDFIQFRDYHNNANVEASLANFLSTSPTTGGSQEIISEKQSIGGGWPLVTNCVDGGVLVVPPATSLSNKQLSMSPVAGDSSYWYYGSASGTCDSFGTCATDCSAYTICSCDGIDSPVCLKFICTSDCTSDCSCDGLIDCTKNCLRVSCIRNCTGDCTSDYCTSDSCTGETLSTTNLDYTLLLSNGLGSPVSNDTLEITFYDSGGTYAIGTDIMTGVTLSANASQQRINRSTTLIGSYPTNYYIYYDVRSANVVTTMVHHFFRYNSDIGNIVSFSYDNSL